MAREFSVIGCQHGHIAIFIDEMLKLGYQCAGIYEQENTALAAKIAEQFNAPLVSDLAEVLKPEVEIVGSSAINNEKIDIVELCEKHGKHIMLDKPAVTNRKDLGRLEAVIERGRIQVGMLLTERFRASVYTIKKLIEQGELGDIVSITTRKPHRLTPDSRPQWHFSKAQNGGIVIDILVHEFDLLCYLTGKEIVEASGYMLKTILPEYRDFYDSASLQVKMEGGIVSQIYCDWHNPEKSWTWGDCRIFVTGTKGSAELRLEGDPLVSKEELLLFVSHEEPLRQMAAMDMNVTAMEDFVARINGKPSVQTHEDILKATRATIDADERAEKLDRTIGG